MGNQHWVTSVAIGLAVVAIHAGSSSAQPEQCSTAICNDEWTDPVFGGVVGAPPNGAAPELLLTVSPGEELGRDTSDALDDELGYHGPWVDVPSIPGVVDSFGQQRSIYLDLLQSAAHSLGGSIDLHPTGQNTVPNAQGGLGFPSPMGVGSRGNSEVSDPIDPITGEFILRDIDLEFPSFGVPIQLVRTYRSRVDYDGPLGPGWDHSYNQRLFNAPSPPTEGSPDPAPYPRLPIGYGFIPGTQEGELRDASCGATLLLSTGEATTIRFHETSSVDGTIHYTSAAAHLELVGTEGPTGPTWSLRSPNGETRRFDADGHLAKWMDANDVGLTFTWTGAGDTARLAAITDSSDRQVELTYDLSGRLTRVGEPGSEIEATYTYDSDGGLASAQRGNGRSESYEYDVDRTRERGDWVPEAQLRAGCALACAMPDGTCEPGGACVEPVAEAMTQCLAFVGSTHACQDNCENECRSLCGPPCEGYCNDSVEQYWMLEECIDFYDNGDPDSPGEPTPREVCNTCDERCEADATFLCGGWSDMPPTMSSAEYEVCRDDAYECCAFGIDCAEDSCNPGSCVSACREGFLVGGGDHGSTSDCSAPNNSGRGCLAEKTASCESQCRGECAGATCTPTCQASCTPESCEALELEVQCETSCTEACVTEGRDGLARRYGHEADLNFNLVQVYDGAGRLYLTNTYGPDQLAPDFDSVIRQDFAQFHPTFARRDLLDAAWRGSPTWAHGLIEDRESFDPVEICPFSCQASSIPDDLMVPTEDVILAFDPVGQVPLDGFQVTATPLQTSARPTLVSFTRNAAGAVVGRIERRTSTTNYFATATMTLPMTLAGGATVTLTTSSTGNVSVSGSAAGKDQLLAMQRMTLLTDAARRVKAYPGHPVEVLKVTSGSCPQPFEVVRVSADEVRTSPATACQGELWVTPMAGVHPNASEAANFYRDGVSALHGTAFHATSLSPGPDGYIWRAGIDGRRVRELAPSAAGRDAATAGVNALFTLHPMFSAPDAASGSEPLFVFHYAPRNTKTGTPLPAPSDRDYLDDIEVLPGGPLTCDPTLPSSARRGTGTLPDQATAVVDFHGARWTYYADARNRVLRTVNHETGAVWSFNYDTAGQLLGAEMPDGARTCMLYDSNGNVSRRIDLPATTDGIARPDPITQNYRYHAANSALVWMSDPRSPDPAQAFQVITRDPRGNPTLVREADGTTTTIHLDTSAAPSRGQVTGIVRPGSVSTAIQYGEWGLPTSVGVQGSGTPMRTTEQAYDEHGRLVWSTTPEGLTTTHSYDNGPFLAFSSWSGDGSSGRETYSYDDDGQIASVIAGTPGAERFRVELARDMTGAITEIKRTALDGSAAPSVVCRNMAPGGRVLETVTGEGIRTRYQYDGEGHVLSVQAGDLGPSPESWDDHCLDHPTGGSQQFTLAAYEYDLAGRMIESTDERGRVTTIKRDGFGRPVMVRRPDGTELRRGYDEMSNVIWEAAYVAAYAPSYRPPSWSDTALLSASQFSYDIRGRLSELKAWQFEGAQVPVGDGNATSTFTYDDTLHTITRTDDAGNQWTTRDDGAGRLLEDRAPGGVARTYSYPDNRTIRSAEPIPSGTLESELALTSWGEVTRTSLRVGSSSYPIMTIAFDEMMRPTTTTSAVTGAQSMTIYDAFGRVRTQRSTVPNGTGEMVSLVYDRDGNPTARVSSTDDATTGSWAWRYDAIGRQVRATDPRGGVTTTTFVSGSQLPSIITDPRNVQLQHAWGLASSTLDVVAVDPAGPDLTLGYTWDGLGRLISARRTDEGASAITNTFSYDSLGGLTGETDSQLPALWSRGHHYDGRGLRTSTTAGGSTWSRQYDALGRLGAVKLGTEATALATYTYAGLDHRTKRKSQNGIETSYSYDSLGRLIGQNEQNLATSQSVATWGWALPLDGVSRRANLRRGTSGTDNAVFRVDGALRLISEDATSTSTFTLSPTATWVSANQTAEGATTSASWQYLLDGRSSWARRTKGTVPTTYTRDAGDALRTINSQTVTVDARGAYKTDGTQAVTYDALGLVKSVVQPGAMRAYRRDALGRVVTETDQASAVTKYAYDGASRILRQRPSGAIDLTIDGGLDEHIVTIEGSTRRFLHQDRRGSVFLTTSSTGAPLEWIKYSAYGEASITSSSINTQFGFNGLPHDFAVGLVDMRARLYRPNLGRFLTPDPLGLVDGSNRFAFVGAAPLSHRDPFGLSSREEATEPDPEEQWLQETYGNVIAERHRNDWRLREEARLAELAANEAERIHQNEEAIAYMTAAHDFAGVALVAGPAVGTAIAVGPAAFALSQFYAMTGFNFVTQSALAYFGASFTYGLVTPAGSPDFPGTFGDEAGHAVRGISAMSSLDDTARGFARTATATTDGVAALKAADLGLSGKGVGQLIGTVTNAGGTRIIDVQLIEATRPMALVGEIRSALPNILTAARTAGVQTLQITASFANPGLRDFVQQQAARYGGSYSSVGGIESITFLLR
jgi:RHS repeat-associated protein